MNNNELNEITQGVEFFVMNGEVMFLEGKTIKSFDLITIGLSIRLRNEIEADPDAERGLELLGITDPNEQLEKFAFCRYGALNNIPDFIGVKTNTEYWDCGCRPCPADGILCKLPSVKNGHLTRHDISVIREIAGDQPNKIIADHLHVTVNTINKECQLIASKIDCHTQKGIAHFAGVNGL